jgi:hypothetical protein
MFFRKIKLCPIKNGLRFVLYGKSDVHQITPDSYADLYGKSYACRRPLKALPNLALSSEGVVAAVGTAETTAMATAKVLSL